MVPADEELFKLLKESVLVDSEMMLPDVGDEELVGTPHFIVTAQVVQLSDQQRPAAALSPEADEERPSI